MASKKRGTLYVGVTNSLEKRVYEHKTGEAKGFTKEYKVNMLVYFEQANSIDDAIRREKQLKNWHRQWKITLIESINPSWEDLAHEVQ